MSRVDSVVGSWGVGFGDTTERLELEQFLGAEFLVEHFVRRLLEDFHTRSKYGVSECQEVAMLRIYARNMTVNSADELLKTHSGHQPSPCGNSVHTCRAMITRIKGIQIGDDWNLVGRDQSD